MPKNVNLIQLTTQIQLEKDSFPKNKFSNKSEVPISN